MSREALQETLSAVMDNEADELELRRVLAACGEDAELRSTWSRYQLARSVMHREPTLPKLDIAAAVSAALADEAAPPKAEKGPWRMVGRLAVAASVTLAVLAGVRLYNQNDALPQMAQQGTTPHRPASGERPGRAGRLQRRAGGAAGDHQLLVQRYPLA